MLVILFGCAPDKSSSPPPPSPLPAQTQSSPESSVVGPLSCEIITGARHAMLISREDPAHIVIPDSDPGAPGARRLVGPDGRGWVYLLDDIDVLRRSSDGGCTWQEVWAFQEEVELLAAEGTDHLYAQGEDDALVWVSGDGARASSPSTERRPGA